MQDLTTLARPYAVAVFKLAQEAGQLDQWSERLQFLVNLAEDPTMKALIVDPRLEWSKLAGLVIDVAGGQLDDMGKNLVRVLAREHGRLGLLPEIAGIYAEERDAAEKREKVEVISAYTVNPKLESIITEAMKRRLKSEVELETRVDRSLIGGVVIRVGDLVIDASLKGRLRQLESSLV